MFIRTVSTDRSNPPYTTFFIEVAKGESSLYEKVLLALNHDLVKDCAPNAHGFRLTVISPAKVKKLLSDSKEPQLVKLADLMTSLMI